MGLNVTTIDLDPRLRPDVVGSVTSLPFPDRTFGATLCCEVLEHMPYQASLEAAREIRRVTARTAVISVPRCVLSFAVLVRLPLLKLREARLRIPLPSRLRQGEHYWELGRPGYPVKRFLSDLQRLGFRVLSSRTPPTNYSHACLVLAAHPR